MSTVGFAVRWTHLVACVFLAGAFSTLLLGGPSDRPTALRWEARLLVWVRGFLVLAIVSGIAVLAYQTALFAGHASAALDARTLTRVLLDTRTGIIWLARHGFLLLLAAFVLIRADLHAKVDWVVWRGQGLLLGLGGLGLIAAASHAAAVTPGAAAAIVVDAWHLIGAGVWAGGLVPLAFLLRAASRETGEDARAYAVLTARRFSNVALAAMIVIVATGVANAVTQVGSVAALVGTTHGRLLLAKLTVLAVISGLAAANRFRLVPALSGPSATVGRPAMRHLARFVLGEALLALGLLAVVVAMTTTPPGRHQQPTWPLPFRLSWDAIADVPGTSIRVFVASQIAVLGVVGVIASLFISRRRRLVFATGTLVTALGAALGLPPLAVDAYPTTYRRAGVPYQATSIASGESVYRERCAACHGPRGAGDGPRIAELPRRPVDLGSARVTHHTAGDLFWWITHGVPGRGMPAFANDLDDTERWDLVNFIRALGAAARARQLGPVVEPDRPWLVAPDFSFSVGPTPTHALTDYRGRRIVLVVLYTLPRSRGRIAELAHAYEVLSLLGVEVIAVPTNASSDAIRQLGSDPRVLFPVVTDGAAEIVQTYRLFATDPHVEFLVDRQGYIRAIAAIGRGEVKETNQLLAEVQQLNAEKALVRAPDEHVH